MESLAPAPAGSRENSTSPEVLSTTDAAESLEANGVVMRVDAGRSSSEDAHPNPFGVVKVLI